MSAQTAETQAKSGSLDYALLLQQLEKRLLTQADAEAVEILNREAVWKELPDDQALQWARLAQIAGLPDLSLAILSWVTDRSPQCVRAWQERVELLEVLGRREAPPESTAGGVRRQGKKRVSTHPESEPGTTQSDKDSGPPEKTIDEPFAAMRLREEGLERYLKLFRGREDCFARQWADRRAGTQGYVPVRRAMNAEDVLDHLRGRRTYGIYLLQQDNRVRLAVIDADLASRFRTGSITSGEKDLVRRENRYLLSRLSELSRERGLPCLIEFSGGKGFHFWFLFAGPVAAALARQALQSVVKQIAPDLSCFNLEVFPKQDQLAGKGLGNLVKLPLGIHRLTGRPSHFLHLADRSPWAQLKTLEKIQPIPLESLQNVLSARESGTLLVHPRHEQWAKEYPELALLGERCPALGQVLVSCRELRTLTLREEKVLLGTLGFLPRSKTLLHHLMQHLPDYNPHLVDYRLSRLRGTPLGCKRIHSLLELAIDQCAFTRSAAYPHPLLHWPDWSEPMAESATERVVNLRDAVARLKEAIGVVERVLAEKAD